jgi:hypothetical protein
MIWTKQRKGIEYLKAIRSFHADAARDAALMVAVP